MLNYDDDDSSLGYGQIKEAYKSLPKDDFLQPYLTNVDFRSSDAGVIEVRYNLYVFDVNYQQNFTVFPSN